MSTTEAASAGAREQAPLPKRAAVFAVDYDPAQGWSLFLTTNQSADEGSLQKADPHLILQVQTAFANAQPVFYTTDGSKLQSIRIKS